MGYVHEYLYRAKVLRWIDGDTVDLIIDLGFRIFRQERIRLAGVNTPELRPPHADFDTDADREAHIEKAKEALAYAEYVAPADSHVLVKTVKDSQGKYGRFLGFVIPDENDLQVSVNTMLLEMGLAEPS